MQLLPAFHDGSGIFSYGGVIMNRPCKKVKVHVHPSLEITPDEIDRPARFIIRITLHSYQD